jgi:hypothetical protein
MNQEHLERYYPLTYHFPDSSTLNLQAALLGDKIQDLQLTQPGAEYHQKLTMQIVTDEEILQLESQSFGVYGIWFELGKNLLIVQACLLPPVKAICWLQILMQLVTFNTLTFYLIALYSDLAAKKPLLQAQALLEKLQPWLTKQSEQIVNLGALFVTPLRLFENLFAELVSLLPQLEAIIATYYSQVHCNHTLQDVCRRIPTLIPEHDQLYVPNKEYNVEHLFYERLLYLRNSYTNLRQACQDFALAPDVRFYQPLLLKTAKKIELSTPWGKMPVELKLHSRAKTASLTIVHPEPYLRKLLIAWSKGLSFEELPLIINALGIIPDRHEL